MTDAPALHIVDLTKTYAQGKRAVPALNKVSLDVPPGEFLAIMGASGSGKSTLLHLCAALDRFDSGELVVAGQNLAQLSDSQLTEFRRKTVGIVFQHFNLIPSLTVRENIALPALLQGKIDDALNARIDALLEKLAIAHRGGHRPDALSGGEQQRAAIARALLLRPPVLFADEPTGNLDSTNAQRFWDLLRQAVGDEHVTVVMVTHEPLAAMQADRVVVLRDGHIAGEFQAQENSNASQLAARYQTMAH